MPTYRVTLAHRNSLGINRPRRMAVFAPSAHEAEQTAQHETGEKVRDVMRVSEAPIHEQKTVSYRREMRR